MTNKEFVCWVDQQHNTTNENKTTLVIHCKGCGKFKDKKSLSTLCTVCLFHMTTEEAIERGFIQA